MKHMSLIQFLQTLSICDGDEALNLVEMFQECKLTIDGLSIEDLPDLYEQL